MKGKDFDADAILIYLNELKSRFDEKLREGESFEEAKKVYMQIKEIEAQLNVINWQNQRSHR
ncbi:MAG TPA: hypothetical protein VM101_10505 [Flavitalea sp.]|nr:hypothetical protein [Flavitalea sp.]